jgi:hypothetical protein
MDFVDIIFKNSFPTSQETHYSSITNSNWLMLYGINAERFNIELGGKARKCCPYKHHTTKTYGEVEV